MRSSHQGGELSDTQMYTAMLSASTMSEASPLSTRSSYTIRGQIGKGAFGQVFSARERDSASPTPLAIKIVPLSAKSSPKSLNKKLQAEAEQEVHVWFRIPAHPNVVQLVHAYREGVKLCMVMNECEHGTLSDQRLDFWKMPEREVASVFKEMLHGVAHVHSCRIVHRDVKPANFLLGGPEGKTVKLTDFGLAAMLPTGGLLTGLFGTPPYLSPEMAGKHGHDESTDLWSLGAACYYLFMGQYPYCIDAHISVSRGEGSAFRECIDQNIRPPTFLRVDSRASDDPVHQPSPLSVQLLQSLLCRSAVERMTAEEAFNHAFLNETEKAPGVRDADSTSVGSGSERDGHSSPTSISGAQL